MLKKNQILDAIKNGYKMSRCMDFRDFAYLAEFCTVEEAKILGFHLSAENTWLPKTSQTYNEQTVLNRMAVDLAFGFDNALNKRGITAELTWEVLQMWMWVLEDPLQNFPIHNYKHYGLPFFKAVALKYNLPNPIGSDNGNELKYSMEVLLCDEVVVNPKGVPTSERWLQSSQSGGPRI